jgi:arylformamidase
MNNDTAYLDALYNNRAAVPDYQDYFDRWEETSEAIRRSMNDRCEKDVPYGDDIMETMDVFLPKGQIKALLMFVHGGYWRSLDKSEHDSWQPRLSMRVSRWRQSTIHFVPQRRWNTLSGR